MHHTIHLRAHHAHAVLPRIALAFSRRRLRILALHYFHLDEAATAEVQIDLDCERPMAMELTAQLRRIVEVSEVWCESVATGGTGARRLVAA